MAKNPGKQLVNVKWGDLIGYPPWLTRVWKLRRNVQKVDEAVAPSTPGGNLLSSEVEQDVTDERTKTDTYLETPAFGEFVFGRQLEELFGIAFPYKESIQTSIPSGMVEATPMGGGLYLVREYDASEVASVLDSQTITYATTLDFYIPPVLKNFEVLFEAGRQDGSANMSGYATGVFKGSFSIGDSVRATCAGGLTPVPKIDMEEFSGQDVPVEVKVFFAKPPITPESIRARLGVQEWPLFKTKSHVLTLRGLKLAGSSEASRRWTWEANDMGGGYQAAYGNGSSADRTESVMIVKIPPCLHGPLVQNQDTVVEAQALASSSIQLATLSFPNNAPTMVREVVNNTYSIPATTPVDIPRSGKYLVKFAPEFFRFGYFMVKAYVLDAGKLQSSN